MLAKVIKIIFVLYIYCLGCITVKAQAVDEYFTIDAPDSVVVGDTLTVRYSLTTKNLQRYLSPVFDGFEFIDMDYDIRKDNFTFIYRLKAVNIGNLLIGPMRVVHQNKDVFSKSKEISVHPDERHEPATKLLKEFLAENAMDPDTCEIRFIYDAPEFTVASSIRSHYFAVIANDAFAGGLDNPILAYGLEYGIRSVEPEFLSVLKYYKTQLGHIGDDLHGPSGKSVHPLLKDIVWGQKEPFNSECPRLVFEGDSVHAVAGCGPVALGQVMKYYNSPGSDDPASLLAQIGSATETIYGPLSTASYSGNYRKALVDTFGFSPQCRLLTLPQGQLFDLTINELMKGRPVVVMNDKHAFVCDGYQDGYLHFNLGWNGAGNGYYRVMSSSVDEPADMLYHSMLINIFPDQYRNASKTVTLDKKNRLKDVLTESEMENLHSLAISGRLTGEDVRLLRRMAGAVDDNDYKSWTGSLQNLDLSMASFTNDKVTPYLTVDAAQCKLKLWREMPVMAYGMAPATKRVEYDFTFMTEDQWEEILKYRINVGKGFRIVPTGRGYNVEYLLEKKKVGRNMFSGCINLKDVRLPDDIIEIGQDAFANTELSGKSLTRY